MYAVHRYRYSRECKILYFYRSDFKKAFDIIMKPELLFSLKIIFYFGNYLVLILINHYNEDCNVHLDVRTKW